jgi:outer membrane protein TolC
LLLTGLAFAGWLAGDALAADRLTAGSPTPRLIPVTPPAGKIARSPADAPLTERLPPVEQPIQMIHFLESVPEPNSQVVRAAPMEPLPGPTALPEEVRGSEANDPQPLAIDLPTSLRLADASNLQMAFAREQVSLALSRVDQANALWLPSVQTGGSYSHHDGAIQQIQGQQITTSRSGFNAGLGAGAYGTTTPTVPGLYANFGLADALFEPLAAKRLARATDRAATTVTNDTLFRVTLAYIELLRASEEMAISQATRRDAQYLADVTKVYSETGQGLPSDANRARTELTVRLNEVRRSREAQRVSSARLAQLLRLDPTVMLRPADPVVVPIEIMPFDAPVKELVVQALSRRPELAENRELVDEAIVRLRREQTAVLFPSIIMGGSYFGMGAGMNEQLAPFHDRLDLDAIAYWQVRNLGFGEAAARRGAKANVGAARFRLLALMDQVAREVVEAHAQVQERKDQISTAKLGIEAAAESQQQNLDRIEQAKGLPIEVLQAIQALAQARREYLRTIVDYNVAQFTLYRAVGWPTRLPEIPSQSSP